MSGSDGLSNYEISLHRQAADLNSIIFLGIVPHLRVLELMAACDIFVLPSDCPEAQSMAICEAMMARNAVVASRVGGVPEVVVDGHTGILVPQANAAQLAQALRHLIEDDHLRARMGAAGRARAEQYTWSNTVAKVQQAYKAVLGARSTR